MSKLKEKNRVRQCVICQSSFSPKRYKSEWGTNTSATKTCSEPCATALRLQATDKCIKICFCKWCGVLFRPRLNLYRTYCSRECGFKGSVQPSKCKRCGKQFLRSFGEKSSDWCSEECRCPQVIMKCEHCGDTFTGSHLRRYCKECNRYKRVMPSSRPCEVCGVVMEYVKHSGRKRCDACMSSRQKNWRNAAKKKRRAIKRGCAVIESINPLHVYERDGWRCQICKRKVSKRADPQSNEGPSIDHIIPLSKGGTHEYRNVQLAHRLCNSLKSNERKGKQLRLLG